MNEWLMIMIKLIDLILILIFVCYMYCNGDPNNLHKWLSTLSLSILRSLLLPIPMMMDPGPFLSFFRECFHIFLRTLMEDDRGRCCGNQSGKKCQDCEPFSFVVSFARWSPEFLWLDLTFRVKLKAWFTPTRGETVASTREAKFSVTREGRLFWRPILATVISAAAAS